jgi:hypothetical protein
VVHNLNSFLCTIMPMNYLLLVWQVLKGHDSYRLKTFVALSLMSNRDVMIQEFFIG